MEILFILLGALIGILVDYSASKVFQGIAEDKGYSDSGRYFWWVFLIPPVGMAMVIALPDLKARPVPSANNQNVHNNDARRNELPDL